MRNEMAIRTWACSKVDGSAVSVLCERGSDFLSFGQLYLHLSFVCIGDLA